MNVTFLEDGTEMFVIRNADAVPSMLSEVWIGRKRYLVNSAPVWTVVPPDGIDPHGFLNVEVHLMRVKIGANARD